jgi:AIR synthase-related protein
MMQQPDYVETLARTLRQSPGLAGKKDIGYVAGKLGLNGQAIAVGDDCAAIPDGNGYLLLAIEGFMNEFVAGDPWFAGWCSLMVNISDIAAMGGRPVAVVDALWSDGENGANPVLDGMRAASAAYGVPIVGGHTNIKTGQGQLAVAILGKAKSLLTSFNAEPGDCLVAAIDHRGAYREPFSNWQAALDAPVERLRADLEILPEIAEQGLATAAKDISQGGLIGTAIMLAESSRVGLEIDITDIPVPTGVPLERWLLSFPSFGFLLCVPSEHVLDVTNAFVARGIVAADIGRVVEGSKVTIHDHREQAVVFDHGADALMDLARPARQLDTVS